MENINNKQENKIESKKRRILKEQEEKIIENQVKEFQKNREKAEKLGLDVNIPNIGTTFNKKIEEISNQFKEHGISMFSSQKLDESITKNNIVSEAIVEDMISKVLDGVNALSRYNQNIKNVIENSKIEEKSLTKVNPIKQIFLKISRAFSKKNEQQTNSNAKVGNKIENAKENVEDIRKINSELSNYNLKDNIAQSIANYIDRWQYNEVSIPSVIEKEVVPTLKQLGLEDQIPKIQEKIDLEKHKDKNDVTISTETVKNSISKKMQQERKIRDEGNDNIR